jgi:hypothetical protein
MENNNYLKIILLSLGSLVFLGFLGFFVFSNFKKDDKIDFVKTDRFSQDTDQINSNQTPEYEMLVNNENDLSDQSLDQLVGSLDLIEEENRIVQEEIETDELEELESIGVE